MDIQPTTVCGDNSAPEGPAHHTSLESIFHSENLLHGYKWTIKEKLSQKIEVKIFDIWIAVRAIHATSFDEGGYELPDSEKAISVRVAIRHLNYLGEIRIKEPVNDSNLKRVVERIITYFEQEIRGLPQWEEASSQETLDAATRFLSGNDMLSTGVFQTIGLNSQPRSIFHLHGNFFELHRDSTNRGDYNQAVRIRPLIADLRLGSNADGIDGLLDIDAGIKRDFATGLVGPVDMFISWNMQAGARGLMIEKDKLDLGLHYEVDSKLGAILSDKLFAGGYAKLDEGYMFNGGDLAAEVDFGAFVGLRVLEGTDFMLGANYRPDLQNEEVVNNTLGQFALGWSLFAGLNIDLDDALPEDIGLGDGV